MRRCEELFGADRGREIHAFVAMATGAACPCESGGLSPLVRPELVAVAAPV